MSTDVATDTEQWTPNELAAKVRAQLHRFNSNQEELLYTAEFIRSRESDLNDHKKRAMDRIGRDFPHVNRSVLDTGWALFDGQLTRIDEAESEQPRKPDTDPEEEASESPTAEELWIESLPQDCWQEYMSAVGMAVLQHRTRKSSTRVLASLLTSVIADFEVLVGNLLRAAITAHPKIIADSGRTFTWADISDHEDLESLRNSHIDKTIDNLLHGSYSDWLDFLEKKLHVNIPPLARHESTIEIFQRRHMIVHNGGIASAQYDNAVGKCEWKGALGEDLHVDSDYLEYASNRVLALGSYFALAVVKNLLKGDKESIKFVQSLGIGILPYNLLQAERHGAVIELGSIVQEDHIIDMGARLRFRANIWLANKRLGKFASCKTQVENWDTSVLEPIFKLAKLALLDDLKGGLELAQTMLKAKDLPLRHWLTWPLLEEIRAYQSSLSPKKLESPESPC